MIPLLAPPTFPDVPVATGARIDLAACRTIVAVDPARGAIRTLRDGFARAHALLAKGTPVRLTIAPGVYREAVTGLDWTAGRVRETPFLIDGRNVEWTGADLLPPGKWTREGDLWSAPWTRNFGNFGYSWGAPKILGHRSEMLAVNGRAMMPRILDAWAVDGAFQDNDRAGEIRYRFVEERDPAAILRPGEFGVSDRRGRIWFRPRPNETPSLLEPSVRPVLLDLAGKRNVAIRGIRFLRAANSDREFGAQTPLRLGTGANAPRNLLIENCRFDGNAHGGLYLSGKRITLRRVSADDNGGSGIAGSDIDDMLWESTRTNRNVWRLWRAGEIGHYTGGFKLHETRLHTIRGHEAIGNATMGLWWDIHCTNVRISDIVVVDNTVNVQFELGAGPFLMTRALSAGGRADDGLHLWEAGSTRVTDSIFTTDYEGNGWTGLYNLRWFGRDDSHATKAPIPVGVNETENCLFVGTPQVKWFGMIDDIRSAEAKRTAPLVYRGRRNVFWSPTLPDFPDRWQWDPGRKGELAARRLDPGPWATSDLRREVAPRRLDPKLVDPANGDFRIGPSSPLHAERSRWPSIVLTVAQREALRRHVEWSGFQPRWWAPVPGE